MWTRTLVTSCVSFGPYEDKPKAILETQLLVFLFLWLLDLFTIVVQRPLVIGTPGYAKGKRKMAYPVWRVPIWSLMNYFHFLLFFLSFSFWSQLKQRINSWAQRKRKLIEKDKKIALLHMVLHDRLQKNLTGAPLMKESNPNWKRRNISLGPVKIIKAQTISSSSLADESLGTHYSGQAGKRL